MSDTIIQVNQVRDFMYAFNQEVPAEITTPPKDILKLRVELIREESEEFISAGDLIGHLDAAVDFAYVAYGTWIAFGYANEDIELLTPSVDLNIKALDQATAVEPPTMPGLLTLRTHTKEITNRLEHRPDVGAPLYALGRLAAHFRLSMNLPNSIFNAAFGIVHHSNMSKRWTLFETQTSLPSDYRAVRTDSDPDAKRPFTVLSQSNKVIKSPSYTPADLSGLL